ncbi:MAG: hypothetical protein GY874_20005 [Desulfobacteraceae bacterium]|nr:hypothetical protein [Desulfobacteraceae bacterium]
MMHTVGDTHAYWKALKAKDEFNALTNKDNQTGSKLRRCRGITGHAAKAFCKDIKELFVTPLTLAFAIAAPEKTHRLIKRNLCGDEPCSLYCKNIKKPDELDTKPENGRCEGVLCYSDKAHDNDKAEEYANDLFNNFCSDEDKKLIYRQIPYRTQIINHYAKKHPDFFKRLKFRNPEYNGKELNSEERIPEDYYLHGMAAPVELRAYEMGESDYEFMKTIITDANNKTRCKDDILRLMGMPRNDLNGDFSLRFKFKFKLSLQKDIKKAIVDYQDQKKHFNNMVNGALGMDDDIAQDVTDIILGFAPGTVSPIMNREVHPGG